MRFDWKDTAGMVGVFILFNLAAAYICGEINPMAWPSHIRSSIIMIYPIFAFIPSIIRRA
jgi:hypothetical protein